jgi:hypothetical protein
MELKKVIFEIAEQNERDGLQAPAHRDALRAPRI